MPSSLMMRTLGMSGKADAGLIHSQTAACCCLFDKHCQWIAVGRLWEGNSPFFKKKLLLDFSVKG